MPAGTVATMASPATFGVMLLAPMASWILLAGSAPPEYFTLNALPGVRIWPPVSSVTLRTEEKLNTTKRTGSCPVSCIRTLRRSVPFTSTLGRVSVVPTSVPAGLLVLATAWALISVNAIGLLPATGASCT